MEDNLEKGGKPAILGEKRTFGGREYIKTASGWKFHGKGTGVKAQEHAAAHSEKEETPKGKIENIGKTNGAKKAMRERGKEKMASIKEKTEKLKEVMDKKDKFDVDKNSHKLTAFGGILPSKIIFAEEANSYHDAGTKNTDKTIPNFNGLSKKYFIKTDANSNSIQLVASSASSAKSGEIRHSNQYGAGRIISYQTPSMAKQSWHLNFIFKTEEEAKNAFNNLKEKLANKN